MSSTRVVIADDHSILREGLILLLESQQDISVVGEAEDGAAALDLVREHRPHVILLDIAMPGINGLEAIEIIRGISPDTAVVILSRYEKEAYIHQALNSGALCYVVKGAPSSDLLEAIRSARKGKFFLSSQVQSNVISSFLRNHNTPSNARTAYSDLSEREIQVFKLLIEGNSSHQISDMLCISSKTVDKHRANIAKKIGIDNPVKMVQYAIRHGLVDPSIWEDQH